MIRSPRPNHTPCSETCTHLDCESARATAWTTCVRCGKPIGYDRPFRRLSTGFDVLEHHDCEAPAIPRHRPRPHGRRT